MRVAGIMSGTSLDGIDVAVVDIVSLRSRRVRIKAFGTIPYSGSMRQKIRRIISNGKARDISDLNFELGRVYGSAVKKICRARRLPWGSIDLAASHGQTIFHGDKSTLQIGEASVIAQELGCPVVSDFRTADVAVGGKGAPLVPYFDFLFFRHPRKNRVVLNIGGIANVTAVRAGANPKEISAFDTGPGNMVIDALVQTYTRGRMLFDRNGVFARKGKVNAALLNRLLNDSYLKKSPPKTTGRERYGEAYVKGFGKIPFNDLIATLTVFTAETIALGIRRFVSFKVDEVIASGGGVHNLTLMNHLRSLLPVPIKTSDEFGIPVDAKEAIAFAVLGFETWNRRASNVPSATGAKRSVVLGKMSW
jgi:anhydro-N-acetylmuramic acid kinase